MLTNKKIMNRTVGGDEYINRHFNHPTTKMRKPVLSSRKMLQNPFPFFHK
ncbi:MAG: hypothetical protein ISR83_03760 [Candidatus Marinimicrobia bacterium]|nr:hypothetical protein [Candidatus Neomarinimicrobiota bacterium]